MSKNWWKVKNLKKEEQKVSSLKISELDIRGDFGSYKKVLEKDTLENSMLEFHNDLEPNSKLLYIKNLLNIPDKKTIKFLMQVVEWDLQLFKLKIFLKSQT
tara:strand:+ start:21 stop:323 length:303 start_codon:yes stop_codon:yes gene_type:complete